MANMAAVNKAIKAEYPDLDIEAVRGTGYIYFTGDDGFDLIEDVCANPTSTSTEDMIIDCLHNIAAVTDR